MHGLGKKSCEQLGITQAEVKRVFAAIPKDYDHWQEVRDTFEVDFPRTSAWIAQCYNFPSDYDEIAMEMFDEVLHGYGVEALRTENCWVNTFWHDCVYLYINTGDTYQTTLFYDTRNERFFSASLGDVVEMVKNRKL